MKDLRVCCQCLSLVNVFYNFTLDIKKLTEHTRVCASAQCIFQIHGKRFAFKNVCCSVDSQNYNEYVMSECKVVMKAK